MRLEKQNVLVTGGAGFIGSHVAEQFIRGGHQVVVLDNLSSGSVDNLPEQAMFVPGDIMDTDLLADLFGNLQFQVVCHHAAQISVRESVADPQFDAQVNIIGTLNLLKQSVTAGVSKFMFASTGGALYGEQDYFPAGEDHPIRPLSPYGVSKATVERYLYFYRQQYGLKTTILRYANVYGPRQNPHGEAGVVAIFAERIAQGGALVINGDGLQTRDYVYVGDVAKANLAALEHDGSLTVNIGTGVETDVVTLVEYLKEAAGRPVNYTHGPTPAGEQRRSVISPSLALDMLGWEPQMTLSDGLIKTYATYSPQTKAR